MRQQHYMFGLFSWKSGAKIFIIMISLLTILFGYWTALFNYQNTPFNGTVINFRSMHYWSFFSTQVNVLILLYFLNLFFFYRSEGITPLTGFTTKMIMAVYTTFIVLIYWTTIFPFDWLQCSYTIQDWYWMMFLQNGIIPILVVTYLIVTNNEEKHYFHNFMKRKSWILFLYPACYLIFTIIGGSLRLLDHYKNPNLFVINGAVDWIKIYDYRFISFNQTVSFINLDGIMTFFLFLILFLILLIILVWFYLSMFNFCYQRKLDKIKKSSKK